MNDVQKQLNKLEVKEKKTLELLLLGMLVGANSENLYNVNELSEDLVEEIDSMRQAAFAIADSNSTEVKKVDDSDRSLIILSASLYLISQLVKRMHVSKKKTFVGRVKESVTGVKPLISRVVNTELYDANLKKMVGNGKKTTKYVWRSMNDKRVCQVCSGRDGNEYLKGAVPAYPHQNCRCFIEVVG